MSFLLPPHEKTGRDVPNSQKDPRVAGEGRIKKVSAKTSIHFNYNSHRDIKKMSFLLPPLEKRMVDADDVAKACDNGNLQVVLAGAAQTPPILPDRDGLHCAAVEGRVAVLAWAAAQKPPILPSEEALDHAIRGGKLTGGMMEVRAVRVLLERGG